MFKKFIERHFEVRPEGTYFIEDTKSGQRVLLSYPEQVDMLRSHLKLRQYLTLVVPLLGALSGLQLLLMWLGQVEDWNADRDTMLLFGGIALWFLTISVGSPIYGHLNYRSGLKRIFDYKPPVRFFDGPVL